MCLERTYEELNAFQCILNLHAIGLERTYENWNLGQGIPNSSKRGFRAYLWELKPVILFTNKFLDRLERTYEELKPNLISPYKRHPLRLERTMRNWNDGNESHREVAV